jgi:hypothetical protein
MKEIKAIISLTVSLALQNVNARQNHLPSTVS